MRRFWQPRWQLGILRNSLADVVSGEDLNVDWIEYPYRDGWMADPFVLDVSDEEVELLVEDFRYKDGKGRISKVTVDRWTNRIVRRKVLLEGGHYSFSAILRVDGKVYIYPEQAHQGRLELFEYCAETETCKFVETLSEELLTDAIIYKGVVYATRMPEPNGKTLIGSNAPWAFNGGSNVLRTFKRETESKDVEPETLNRQRTLNLELGTLNQAQTYEFDECIARNAGDFFEVDGVTYRPAQECNRWYGNAVSIQRFEDGKFTEVRRILGIHTLNSYKGVTVVDRKIFPFKWLYWLLRRADK